MYVVITATTKRISIFSNLNNMYPLTIISKSSVITTSTVVRELAENAIDAGRVII
jgi:DNA mismatch repair ATPase MutL